jgi:hypothetical protein
MIRDTKVNETKKGKQSNATLKDEQSEMLNAVLERWVQKDPSKVQR